MKTLATFLIVAIQMMASANAAECQFQQVAVDPFTKKAAFVATERYRLTSWIRGVINRDRGHNSEFQLSAVREKDQNYLALKIRFRRSSGNEPTGEDLRDGLHIPAGAELLVLMADESVTSLYSDKAYAGNTRYEIDEGKYVIDTSTEIRYRLDADTADALLRQDATDVRFAAVGGRLGFVNRDGTIDFVIARNARDFFKQAILCLQTHPTAG